MHRPALTKAQQRRLEKLAREDEHAARQVAERVEKSIATIQTMPLIGTPTAAPGVRRYPIPKPL